MTPSKLPRSVSVALNRRHKSQKQKIMDAEGEEEMSTGVLPVRTPARLEISADPFHLGPRRLAHARQLQREGRTMTEIASALGLERAVVVANLYWRAAYPELVL